MQFLLGEYIRGVMRSIARDCSPSISDLECGNASLKRFVGSCGRSETFATTAAKFMIHEGIRLHKELYGAMPEDVAQNAAQQINDVVHDLRGSVRPRRGTASRQYASR
jgi:hypothetical protein